MTREEAILELVRCTYIPKKEWNNYVSKDKDSDDWEKIPYWCNLHTRNMLMTIGVTANEILKAKRIIEKH